MNARLFQFRLACGATFATVAAAAKPQNDLSLDLQSTLQPLLDSLALKYNTSFALGFSDTDVALGLAAGIDDHKTGRRVTPTSAYPSGSVTKTWTAATTMQLVERGIIGLDDPIRNHIDPLFQTSHGTTLQNIWGNNDLDNVTVRQLLSMSSGLNDYNDYLLTQWTLSHPQRDFIPYMFLLDSPIVNKTMVCSPGNCSLYSSVGYELLGFALANHLSMDASWMGFDQLEALPPTLRNEFANVFFPLKGKCTEYLERSIVHQYHTDLYNSQLLNFSDIIDLSCLNGWTMGNIAAPPLELAKFYHKLLTTKEIVSEASVEEMMKFKPMTTGWFPGLPYGLGLMIMGYPSLNGGYQSFIGHGGEDWGSGASLAGVHSELGYGITVATNSNLGMNCSLPDLTENFYEHNSPTCQIVDAIHAVLQRHGRNASRLNCGKSQAQMVEGLRRKHAKLESATMSCVRDASHVSEIIV